MITEYNTNWEEKWSWQIDIFRFQFRKGIQPIKLHHHVDYILFSDWCINIICRFIKRDLVYNTLFNSSLIAVPSRFHTVPHIACQIRGARNDLMIDNGLLNGTRLCISLSCIRDSCQICTRVTQEKRKCNEEPAVPSSSLA